MAIKLYLIGCPMREQDGYHIFARYYDALTANVDYAGRAAYFSDLIRKHAPNLMGGLLLDLACGTGSLSFCLAELGFDVVGADASAEMLSEAMRKRGENGQEILFLCQSMCALDLYGTVDVTVCALDSLNHLADTKSLEDAFARVALFTNPGGLFLFDVNTVYKHREILANHTFVYEAQDVFCTWQNHWHPADDRINILLDFFAEQPDGGYIRYTEQFSERIFSHEILCRCLRDNGFALLAVYGDDTVCAPHAATQREIYVAQKIGLHV